MTTWTERPVSFSSSHLTNHCDGTVSYSVEGGNTLSLIAKELQRQTGWTYEKCMGEILRHNGYVDEAGMPIEGKDPNRINVHDSVVISFDATLTPYVNDGTCQPDKPAKPAIPFLSEYPSDATAIQAQRFDEQAPEPTAYRFALPALDSAPTPALAPIVSTEPAAAPPPQPGVTDVLPDGYMPLPPELAKPKYEAPRPGPFTLYAQGGFPYISKSFGVTEPITPTVTWDEETNFVTGQVSGFMGGYAKNNFSLGLTFERWQHDSDEDHPDWVEYRSKGVPVTLDVEFGLYETQTASPTAIVSANQPIDAYNAMEDWWVNSQNTDQASRNNPKQNIADARDTTEEGAALAEDIVNDFDLDSAYVIYTHNDYENVPYYRINLTPWGASDTFNASQRVGYLESWRFGFGPSAFGVGDMHFLGARAAAEASLFRANLGDFRADLMLTGSAGMYGRYEDVFEWNEGTFFSSVEAGTVLRISGNSSLFGKDGDSKRK